MSVNLLLKILMKSIINDIDSKITGASEIINLLKYLLLWDANKAYWIGSTIAQVEAALLAFLGIFVLFRAEQLRNEMNYVRRKVESLNPDPFLFKTIKSEVIKEDHYASSTAVYGVIIDMISKSLTNAKVIDNSLYDAIFASEETVSGLIKKVREFKEAVEGIKTNIETNIAQELGDNARTFFNEAIIRWGANEVTLNTRVFGILSDYVDYLKDYISKLEDYVIKRGISFRERSIDTPGKFPSLAGLVISTFKIDDDKYRWPSIRKGLLSDLEKIRELLVKFKRYTFDGKVDDINLGRLVSISIESLRVEELDTVFKGIVRETQAIKSQAKKYQPIQSLFINLAYEFETSLKDIKTLTSTSVINFIILGFIILYSVGYLLLVNNGSYSVLLTIPSVALIISFIIFVGIALWTIIRNFNVD